MVDWLGSGSTPLFVLVAVASVEQLLGRASGNGPDGPRWVLNLTLFGFQQLFGLAAAGLIAELVGSLTALSPLTAPSSALPDWVLLPVAVVMLDATTYGVHRVSHAIPLLWRFHSVHHTDRDLDVTTTLRHHPLEAIPGILVLGLVTGAFGLGLWPLAAFGVLGFAVQALAHARLDLPAGLSRALGWVLVTPAIHGVHHSPVRAETDSNYGELLSVWDRLFGTYMPPRPGLHSFGLDNATGPRFHSIVGVLAQPFRRAI